MTPDLAPRADVALGFESAATKNISLSSGTSSGPTSSVITNLKSAASTGTSCLKQKRHERSRPSLTRFRDEVESVPLEGTVERCHNSTEVRGASMGVSAVCAPPLQIQRQEMWDLLDEWGQKQIEAVLDALDLHKESRTSSPSNFTDKSHNMGKMSASITAATDQTAKRRAGSWASCDLTETAHMSKYQREAMLPTSTAPWNAKWLRARVMSDEPLYKFPSLRTRSLSATFSEGPRSSYLLPIVSSQWFEILIAVAVIANTILIGWTSHISMARLDVDPPLWTRSAEWGFTSLFTLELLMKLWVYGWYFFFCTAWRSNVFSSALVMHGLLEMIFEVSDIASNSAFLRLLRAIRVLRLLRIIRHVNGFQDLNIIMHSIKASAMAGFWSVLFLTGIIYMFGVVFLQVFTQYLQSASPSLDEKQVVQKYWGTLGASMVSLLMTSTGGQDWEKLSDPLWKASPLAYCLFLFYVAYFIFVVGNTVTSVFVEATIRQAASDKSFKIRRELRDRSNQIKRLHELFECLDEDGDGLIHLTDCISSLHDKHMEGLFLTLGIDVGDVVAVYGILAAGSDTLDLQTFVVGCVKLINPAKSLDVYTVRQQQKEVCEQVSTLLAVLRKEGINPTNRPRGKSNHRQNT